MIIEVIGDIVNVKLLGGAVILDIGDDTIFIINKLIGDRIAITIHDVVILILRSGGVFNRSNKGHVGSGGVNILVLIFGDHMILNISDSKLCDFRTDTILS